MVDVPQATDRRRNACPPRPAAEKAEAFCIASQGRKVDWERLKSEQGGFGTKCWNSRSSAERPQRPQGVRVRLRRRGAARSRGGRNVDFRRRIQMGRRKRHLLLNRPEEPTSRPC